MDVLAASTRAIKSGSVSDDSTYAAIAAQIQDLTARRDALAAEIKVLLDGAAFSQRAIDEREAKRLIARGREVLQQASALNP